MDYVNLGGTGLKVSRICLGTMTYGSSKWREWVLDEEASRPLLKQALEAGINFFDTADMYSLGASEEVLGRALQDFGPGRDKIVIATKVFYPMGDEPNQRGLSRKHIMHAVDDSLRRLGTDYIDLYYIHRFDPETPIEETIQALDDLVRAGKVRYLGASSMPAWRFAQMRYGGRQRLDSFRGDAKSLQSHIPRRGTGDDAVMSGGGDRGLSLESVGAGPPGREAEARERAGGDRHLPEANLR